MEPIFLNKFATFKQKERENSMSLKETKPYDPRTIVLYPDKAELFKMVWPSLLDALLVPLLLIAWSSGNLWLRFASLFAGLPLFLWESAYLPRCFRLFLPKPVIIVNETGIAYDPITPWFAPLNMHIHWEEIAAMFLCELSTRSKKGTKDRINFVIQHKLLHRFPFAYISLPDIETPFMVFDWTISPCSLDELLAQICARYQHEIEAHGIEIGAERMFCVLPGKSRKKGEKNRYRDF
jgi:hypothetical protein